MYIVCKSIVCDDLNADPEQGPKGRSYSYRILTYCIKFQKNIKSMI